MIAQSKATAFSTAVIAQSKATAAVEDEFGAFVSPTDGADHAAHTFSHTTTSVPDTTATVSSTPATAASAWGSGVTGREAVRDDDIYAALRSIEQPQPPQQQPQPRHTSLLDDSFDDPSLLSSPTLVPFMPLSSATPQATAALLPATQPPLTSSTKPFLLDTQAFAAAMHAVDVVATSQLIPISIKNTDNAAHLDRYASLRSFYGSTASEHDDTTPISSVPVHTDTSHAVMRASAHLSVHEDDVFAVPVTQSQQHAVSTTAPDDDEFGGFAVPEPSTSDSTASAPLDWLQQAAQRLVSIHEDGPMPTLAATVLEPSILAPTFAPVAKQPSNRASSADFDVFASISTQSSVQVNFQFSTFATSSVPATPSQDAWGSTTFQWTASNNAALSEHSDVVVGSNYDALAGLMGDGHTRRHDLLQLLDAQAM